MREYETVFICNPNLPDSQHKQLVDRFTSVVERHSGRLFYARNMGKRALAYPISKQTKGLYTCLDYAAEGQVVGEIERGMRLDENVLRFLTVVKNEAVDIEARAAEIIAKGEDAAAPSTDEVTEEIVARAKASEADDSGEATSDDDDLPTKSTK